MAVGGGGGGRLRERLRRQKRFVPVFYSGDSRSLNYCGPKASFTLTTARAEPMQVTANPLAQRE